jgi:hypothetical protein
MAERQGAALMKVKGHATVLLVDNVDRAADYYPTPSASRAERLASG